MKKKKPRRGHVGGTVEHKAVRRELPLCGLSAASQPASRSCRPAARRPRRHRPDCTSVPLSFPETLTCEVLLVMCTGWVLGSCEGHSHISVTAREEKEKGQKPNMAERRNSRRKTSQIALTEAGVGLNIGSKVGNQTIFATVGEVGHGVSISGALVEWGRGLSALHHGISS